jgi:hypothetical protein
MEIHPHNQIEPMTKAKRNAPKPLSDVVDLTIIYRESEDETAAWALKPCNDAADAPFKKCAPIIYPK